MDHRPQLYRYNSIKKSIQSTGSKFKHQQRLHFYAFHTSKQIGAARGAQNIWFFMFGNFQLFEKKLLFAMPVTKFSVQMKYKGPFAKLSKFSDYSYEKYHPIFRIWLSVVYTQCVCLLRKHKIIVCLFGDNQHAE